MRRTRLHAFEATLIATAMLLPLLVPALLAEEAHAQPVAEAPQPPAADVPAGVYAFDPDHSLVGFKVDHLGVTPYWGTFGYVTGRLELDPAHPENARVSAVIPIRTLSVASAALLQHLMKPARPGAKPDFFGGSPQPARFVSTSVDAGAAPGTALVHGNLTLNGVTRPVDLETRFHGAAKAPPQMGGGQLVGFDAHARIRRSDFGLGMGVPMVSDMVELTIAAAFKTAPGATAIPADQDACGAYRVRHFMGQPMTPALRAKFAGLSGAKVVRVHGVNDPVTQDFRPDRLDVVTDAQGRIMRLSCG